MYTSLDGYLWCWLCFHSHIQYYTSSLSSVSFDLMQSNSSMSSHAMILPMSSLDFIALFYQYHSYQYHLPQASVHTLLQSSSHGFSSFHYYDHHQSALLLLLETEIQVLSYFYQTNDHARIVRKKIELGTLLLEQKIHADMSQLPEDQLYECIEKRKKQVKKSVALFHNLYHVWKRRKRVLVTRNSNLSFHLNFFQ